MTKHERYNRSEKGRARWRRYARSPKYTAVQAAYNLRKLGAA
jgi:hypothetical protein